MRISARRTIAIAAAILLGLAAAGLIACSTDPAAKPKPSAPVLVFSKTAGFRHDSIPAGIAAIRAWARNGFTVAATEDAGAFTAAKRLRRYEAVVFLSTTGDVLNAAQQSAFESYIRHGRRLGRGVHAAADTEYDWPFYGKLVGAYFKQHPAIQQATVEVEDRAHPSTAAPARRWTRTDEWYDYRTNPRAHGPRPRHPRRVHLLAAARWAPTTRSPGARPTRAAAPSTPAAATPTSPTPSRLPRPPAGRHLGRAGLARGGLPRLAPEVRLIR